MNDFDPDVWDDIPACYKTDEEIQHSQNKEIERIAILKEATDQYLFKDPNETTAEWVERIKDV